ncbi:MAG: aminoacyl-histidine dipeptidase [Rikenellaceae bacterium]|nr:aminoacyl-histidine dipeptidase [Rikenellaceae bacterium]
MNTAIDKLQPQLLWKHFAAICHIPHPSYHEAGVRDYIVAFAREHGIEHTVDETGNVILRKGATPGYEGRKTAVMQSHMDMVPQKNGDKAFDFERDPIAAYIDGGWVTADGTTLGADNGIGMAAVLAVFESRDLPHGPIEALFTVTEETGMVGAFGLKPGVLKGDILLNLDSETEGELYVGCAGGLDANITFPYGTVALPAGEPYEGFRIDLKGLKGGHSGIEIILGRGNANKLLNRFLRYAAQHYGLLLASIDGGGLRNAIPREATAVVAVPARHADAFATEAARFGQMYRTELKGVDDGVTLAAMPVATPGAVFEPGAQARLFDAVCGCPNGVMRMSASMKGLVQTSTNLARVVSDGKAVQVQCLLRSASNTEKEELGQMIASVFGLAGATVGLTGAYDGWNPDLDSPILKTMVGSYEQLFGHKPAITAIHAGLECGIIGGAYPDLDMISFGPTIRYPHSPDEEVEIASVQKFWDYLCLTLKNIPQK